MRQPCCCGKLCLAPPVQAAGLLLEEYWGLQLQSNVCWDGSWGCSTNHLRATT